MYKQNRPFTFIHPAGSIENRPVCVGFWLLLGMVAAADATYRRRRGLVGGVLDLA